MAWYSVAISKAEVSFECTVGHDPSTGCRAAGRDPAFPIGAYLQRRRIARDRDSTSDAWCLLLRQTLLGNIVSATGH